MSRPSAEGPVGLHRVLTLRDVVQFFIVAVVSVRWIPAAAALGPSALVVWLIVGAALFLPLAFAVTDLARRSPGEGGLYVWVSEAFGPFAGFLSGWMYWASNLVYFPAMLYFMAGNLLFLAGSRGEALASSPAFFTLVALLGLALTLVVNLLGLEFGRRLNALGAWGTWIPITVLVATAIACAVRFGSATAFAPASFVPSARLPDLVLWSTLAFGFGGVEAASFMGDEIVDARRTVPRAIVLAGGAIVALYMLGTAAVLIVVPRDAVSGLTGLAQAIANASGRLGVGWLSPLCAALLAIASLGAVGAWLSSTSRLPFVAGADRHLPASFARLHPRTGAPVTALCVQSAGAAAFTVLGQFGTSVKGAYDALVAMGVIAYFIPFLALFAAWWKLEGRRKDGSSRARPVVLLALLGFATTFASIVVSVLPPPGSDAPALAVAKVVGGSLVLLLAGVLLDSRRRRRG